MSDTSALQILGVCLVILGSCLVFYVLALCEREPPMGRIDASRAKRIAIRQDSERHHVEDPKWEPRKPWDPKGLYGRRP